jgi:hypothetical protein
MHTIPESPIPMKKTPATGIDVVLLSVWMMHIGYLLSVIGWIDNADSILICEHAIGNPFYIVVSISMGIYHSVVPLSYTIANEHTKCLIVFYVFCALACLFLVSTCSVFTSAAYKCVDTHACVLLGIGTCQCVQTISLMWNVSHTKPCIRVLWVLSAIHICTMLTAIHTERIEPLICSALFIMLHHGVFVCTIERTLKNRACDLWCRTRSNTQRLLHVPSSDNERDSDDDYTAWV